MTKLAAIAGVQTPRLQSFRSALMTFLPSVVFTEGFSVLLVIWMMPLAQEYAMNAMITRRVPGTTMIA